MSLIIYAVKDYVTKKIFNHY